MSCSGRVLAVERGFDVAVNGCGNKAIGVSSKKCQVALEKSKNIFFRTIMGDFDAVFACFGVVFSIFCECLFFEGVKWGRYGPFL